MEPKDIPGALEAIGKTRAELARFMNLDPSSLSKTIKGHRRLLASELSRIEEFFANHGEVERLSERRSGSPTRIPVYGYAKPGDPDAVLFDAGKIIEWIEPPALRPAGDLVAIRVLGDAMEPRLFAGELVVAQLGVPPARGRDCFVELLDGSGLVKGYAGLSMGHVLLRHWNPDQDYFKGNRDKDLFNFQEESEATIDCRFYAAIGNHD